MQSKQKMLFLPEAHTDFIYARVGEETGFFGRSWSSARLSSFCGEVCALLCVQATISGAISL